MRKYIAPVALIPFLAFTCWILADTGYVGFLAVVLDDAPGQQVFIDLVLACMMLLPFLHRDAKQQGVAFWPWLLLTLVLGSIGPLMYFAYTGWRPTPAPKG